MDHAPRCGEIWKSGNMLKAHNCVFSSWKRRWQRQQTAEGELLKTYILKKTMSMHCQLCLRIVNVLVSYRWWWLRWKWLHASDGVYIFQVSESSILQSTTLLHLFHEIGPTRNWFLRREFKQIRRGFSWKSRAFSVRTTHFCETKQNW